jgi:hypothetical protein
MRLRSLLAILLTVAGTVLSGGAAAKDVLAPEDFAYAWPLTLGSGDFHRVTVPAEVYAAARGPDLADVRILDARGRPVPQFVRVPEPEDGEARAALDVQVFPVGVNQRDADVVARVSVETQPANPSATTSVTVVNQASTLEASSPAHWIAVLDEPVEHVHAVRLGWVPLSKSFVGNLFIETSEDLESWRPVGGGSIAAFASGRGQTVRDNVQLHGQPHRYLRITPRDLPESFQVATLRLQFAPPRGEPQRAWRSTPLPADGSALEIDLGAAVPVDRFDVVPSVDTGLVHARLHSRATVREPWRLIGQAVFYRLDRTAGGLASAPADVSRTLARYWKLDLSGGPAFAGELRLAWRPAEIVFLAQGEPPFRLFAGSMRQAKPSPDLVRLDESLRSIWRDKHLEAAAPATLVRRETVSGEDAYSIQTREAWRVWVLWALLIAGVALVAWMAWRVARGLKHADAERTA